ncbi:hypothetical protein EGJ86_19245 [Pseudomonas sp. o96-267]|uniref:hypothetical protein n=1 Tax=Pseudomonas sp. o96-267 TaxID=2479853 RepID=UPI000F76F912|nr:MULTISPECIES: hypothetical protein [Pseudomonas]MDH0959096.1 hypothetical protein [Pseudomonas chengduensis]MDV5863595.1 hypothetical protein [Pseudomonas mendocina]RRV31709.1 hypothetical protein EGJ86_19245 [Pseudomonas sp. o96-267]
MTAKPSTSLRAYAEQRASEAKVDESVQPLGRPRVYSASPLDIKVYPERNIRPISPETIAEYKQAFLRGDVFPPIDVTVEQGQIVLKHGYHRTLAAQELVREKPEMAHLQLEMREFKGNASDTILLMLNSQNSLDVDPVSRAEAYRTLLNQGMPMQKIAERIGKVPEHVSQQLILVEADEAVKQAIREKKIAATAVIELLRNEKETGEPHGKVVRQMLENAAAAGKTKATMKHRAPAAPRPGVAPKLSMKVVRTSLKSISEISGSLRDALGDYQASTEEGAENNAKMVAVSLPASKIAELLQLLDSQNEHAAQEAVHKTEGE